MAETGTKAYENWPETRIKSENGVVLVHRGPFFVVRDRDRDGNEEYYFSETYAERCYLWKRKEVLK